MRFLCEQAAKLALKITSQLKEREVLGGEGVASVNSAPEVSTSSPPHLVLGDLEGINADVRVLYEHRRKDAQGPTTLHLPENALHLELNHPDAQPPPSFVEHALSYYSASLPATSEHEILPPTYPIQDASLSTTALVNANQEPDSTSGVPQTSRSRSRPRIVHFRSRVHIASRAHHHRDDAVADSSPSPSSSVSVPLRRQHSSTSSSHIPLGHKKWRKKKTGHGHVHVHVHSHRNVDERTPLVNSGHGTEPRRVYMYVGDAGGGLGEGELGSRRSKRSSAERERDGKGGEDEEVDAVYGPWPWRLLNYQVCSHFFAAPSCVRSC